MLLLLAALWGGSFLMIRVAAPVLGPLPLVDVRVCLAGSALLLYALAIGKRPALRARGRAFLTLGALNAALPFTLIAFAELHLSASLAAILNATTPLFAALAATIWLGQRLTAARILGLLLGVAGVAALVGWQAIPISPLMLISVGLSLLAALLYGLGGIYAGRAFGGVPSLTLAIGQQLAAGIWLLPFALAAAPGSRVTPGAVVAMIVLALAGTSLGYLLYFNLIARVGATSTLSVTYLVPVFGVFWGRLLLGEAIHVGTIAGLAIILISVTLVTGSAGALRRLVASPGRGTGIAGESTGAPAP
jgi:drug/metabolite transporter (DMT)-like permease